MEGGKIGDFMSGPGQKYVSRLHLDQIIHAFTTVCLKCLNRAFVTRMSTLKKKTKKNRINLAWTTPVYRGCSRHQWVSSGKHSGPHKTGWTPRPRRTARAARGPLTQSSSQKSSLSSPPTSSGQIGPTAPGCEKRISRVKTHIFPLSREIILIIRRE